MNDPNAVDDTGLIEDLEKEFMAMAEAGNVKAVRYAMEESVVFSCTVVGTVAAILSSEGPGHKLLLEVLAEYAAPRWALEEFPRRIASMQEMEDDWAGPPELMSEAR